MIVEQLQGITLSDPNFKFSDLNSEEKKTRQLDLYKKTKICTADSSLEARLFTEKLNGRPGIHLKVSA